MRVLVTGGCGFVGSHLVELLARKQYPVMVIDDLSTGHLEWLGPVFEKHRALNFDMCSVANWAHVDPVIAGFKPEAIIHLAAQPAISTSWSDPLATAEVNEIGTLNMLMSARNHGVRRFVFVSTSAVYAGRQSSLPEGAPVGPESPYGISKYAGECYCRVLMPDTVVLRLGNVYGPRQVPIGENQVVPLMLRHLLHGDPFSIHGDGEQTRDFVYVKDVASALFKALWKRGGTYNIGSGRQTSVNELAGRLSEIFEVNGYPWKHDEIEEPRRAVRLDVRAASKELGWKARTSLEDGLLQTADSWRAEGVGDQSPHRA